MDPQNTKFVSPIYNNVDPYYSSIQEAINNSLDGFVIFIYPGIYNEVISTSKRLQLVGINKNKCIISYNTSHNQDVFTIFDKGEGVVSISNLTIEQNNIDGGEALDIGGPSGDYDGDVYIDNVILKSANEEALQIKNAKNVYINNSNLIGSSAGLYLSNNVEDAVYSVIVKNSFLQGTRFVGVSAAGGQILQCQNCNIIGGHDETFDANQAIYIGQIKSTPILNGCSIIGGTNNAAIKVMTDIGIQVINSKLLKSGNATYTIVPPGGAPPNGFNVNISLCAMNADIHPDVRNNIANPTNVVNSRII